MRASGNNRPFFDRQDTELERLRKERDELRAREQKTRSEAEKAKERLANLVSASRTFASSMRARAEERRRSRRRLATQHAMTRALAEARDFEEATPDILKILGDGLGWAIGILWLVDEEAGVLRCDAIWRSSDSFAGALEAACRNASIGPGKGLPGRAWARGGPVWVEDVLDNEGFLWTEAAARDGLHAALAFPIQNKTTVGVLEFLTGEASPPDDDLLLLATVIGGQIGQFVERRRAEEALRRSEELLRTVVEGAPVALFALDREGVFTLLTGRGLETLELEPDTLVGRSVFEVYADRPDLLSVVQRALAGEAFTSEQIVYGTPFETHLSPMRGPDGEVTGVIGVSTDTTERKKAEEVRERFLAQEWRSHAEAAERRRIGRELHDRVAHSMGVVHQSIELYKAFLPRDPSRAEVKLTLAQDMAKTALNSTRDLSMALRDSTADGDLRDTLSNFLENSVPPEIEARLSVEGDESSIPTRAREQLFLILREAARNAVSHSECSRLSIRLDTTAMEVVGLVEDDGRGFEPEGPTTNGGSGLHYMKERAALVKGICEVSSEPSGGTSVRVSIPLEPGQ